MPITPTYDSVARKLTIVGDALANTITVSRDGAGTLSVNGGTIPITGGPATTANTDLIEASGLDLNDVIALDETNGALPPADLFGGNGDDTLTGGTNGDRLFGDANNDVLLGLGGTDQLFGGAGNDTLTGGTGADTMSGEDGNDTMVWNPGDGTDVMEGGPNSDIAQINGGAGAEVFTITANVARVDFDRVDPAPFSLDIGTTESLVLNAGGGNDSISTTGNLAALIALTLNGGAGDDTILASNGVDIILGDIGNDFVDGQQGNDFAFLGDGTDTFQWDPGDGSDTIEGQAGNDLIVFNGNGANEIINLQANGGRTRLTRDVGSIVLDPDDVELFTINAAGGTDTVVISDLTGTDAIGVTLNLASTIGGSTGDALIDLVTLVGDSGGETITVIGAAGSLAVTGTPVSLNLNQVDATDSLTINAGGGNDTLNASTVGAGIALLIFDGGTGDDVVEGTGGADTLLGGSGVDVVDGNPGLDTAFLGPDNDVFEWDPGDGSDVVEGQGGTDELRFNGSNASENVTIQPNGGRSIFLRDVASVTMDMDDIETIRFRALGGVDNVTVANMAGTDVTQVIVDLAASGGGGDAQLDRVTVQGTDVADVIAVGPGSAVTGLAAATRVESSEGADRLIISANGGDDTINAGTATPGQLTLEFLGGLGADIIIGSGGGDFFTGGDGNDTALMGAGDDAFVWNPGDDNDTLEGQAGTDRLDFNGSGASEGITISPNGGRVILFRDVAAVTMDMNDLEQIVLGAGAGNDAIVVNDLTGTDVGSITFNLAGTIGGTTADAVVDQVTLFGGSAGETVNLVGGGGSISVVGLPASVAINQLDFTDTLTINAGGGNDAVNASELGSGLVVLTIDGGLGDDAIHGTGGPDTLLGGDGNDIVDGNQGLDTVFLGAGNDRFDWNPGDASDVIEGQGGTDELFFNGSNANEVVSILPNGGRTIFQRDVAAISMDLNDLETITFNAIGGTDTITVADLAGTEVTKVVLNLAGNGGGGDNLRDVVTVNGGAGGETVTIASAAPGTITIDGLAADTEVQNFEWRDDLVIVTVGGNDTVDASGLGAGASIEIFGGDGDDVLTGGAGDDVLHGGLGTDTMIHTGGNDYFDGGDGLLIIAGG